MRIRVLLFGVLADHLAPPEQLLDLAPASTAAAVLDHYRSTAPSPLWSSVAIAVNQHYAPATHPLSDGDEVALLPPVSGGQDHKGPAPESPNPESPVFDPRNQAHLTRDPLHPDQLLSTLKSPPDGAIVLFDGIVRNNTRGRETLFLDYQGYEAMALTQMRQLAAQALERFPIRQALIAHRLGRIQIGESSVVIAVASAHRAPAFDACRWLIDTLKTTVPIWKKEHFADGAVWAPGEPFPPNLTPAHPVSDSESNPS